MPLSSYLPQDRRRALARGASLPDRTTGTAIFADISGFTALTGRLRQSLGPRRGAETLSGYLNAAYTALITTVERYGGNVIDFAGDAITCWFDDAQGTAAPRAVACAVALQTAMEQFAAMPLPNGEVGKLTIKIGVATGPARRLVVGDQAYYWLDVLAGETVSRTAAAEQLASPPEILLDQPTIDALGEEAVTLSAWRTAAETGDRFGVLERFTAVTSPTPTPTQPPPLPDLDEAEVRPWLSSLVYQREKAGHSLLLTDFRPCTALFVYFTGIDYAADTAVTQLNQFISQLQAIPHKYEGVLIDLTFGDKGSYAYINFGALSVHEDDSHRAVKTALQLREVAQSLPFLEPLQIGITAGVTLTGAHGATTRRHYGALGSQVNLAAHLMQTAAPGQILADESVWGIVADQFQAVPQPPLTLKGVAQPVQTYAISGKRPLHRIQLLQPNYALPLVGREAELAVIGEKLAQTQAGQSQIVAVMGEAGIGKSRLLAEAIRLGQRQGFAVYGGACQSDGRDVPYQPWRAVWRALLGLEEDWAPARQIARLTAVLQERLPHRLDSLPLLGWLLDLPIQDNQFTSQLLPQYRQSVLHALLEALLQQAARQTPLLIALEDLHWLDPLSHDLLEALVQATAVYPVCFLLAHRPPQRAGLQVPRLEKRANFTLLPLAELSPLEAAQLARTKLTQLYPDGSEGLYNALIDDLLARAQGNPFFMEELLNYLRSQPIELGDISNGLRLKLPYSLHALILSRIDQLSASQKTTLRVASIIGRLFSVAWLTGYYPEVGNLAQVEADLTKLDALDLTLLETDEPELVYLFKHMITQEAIYESLPFAARARLHEQLAAYLEQLSARQETAVLLEPIAYHYGQSHNQDKQRLYFQKAATAAQAAFANETALDYLDRLLPLLTDPLEQAALHRQRGTILEHIGHYEQAIEAVNSAIALAQTVGDAAQIAQAHYRLARLQQLRGGYAAAHTSLTQARDQLIHLNDLAELARVYIEMGIVWRLQDDYDQARVELEKALTLAKTVSDKAVAAFALKELGTTAYTQGDHFTARPLYEQCLALYQEMEDKWGIATVSSNLGQIVWQQGDAVAARQLYEQGLALFREMGSKRGIANVLNNLGLLAQSEGDLATARSLYEESLTLCQEMGEKIGIANVLTNLGSVAAGQGDLTTAYDFCEQGLAISREIGNKWSVVMVLTMLGNIALRQKDTATADQSYQEAALLCYEMDNQRNLFEILEGMAALHSLRGDFPRAARLAAAADTLRHRLGGVWDEISGERYRDTIAAARAALAEAAFETAWDEGAQMSVAEVVAYSCRT